MSYVAGVASGIIIAVAAMSYANWPAHLGQDRIELIPPQRANIECNEYGSMTVSSWTLRGFGGGREHASALYFDNYLAVDLPRIFGCEDLVP